MPLEDFKIKTEHFEGPLDLLLNLIEKHKLFINDISLSKVADDFIAHTKEMGNFPIAESAQFILIASTLLLIKSKSLLPTLDLTEEEETSIHDLEERLKLYQRIRDLSTHVHERFGKNISFEKNSSRIITPVFSPDESMTIPNLLTSIKSVLVNLPKKEVLPKAVVRQVVSLEDMIESLTDRIKTSMKMSFKDFAGVGKKEKVHVIVSFLAMLELVKQGVVDAVQHEDSDDIHIETQNVSVPRYN
ncbi:segregation/condensation protein A [Candidatus Parcubacteria bacterium]|nr:segregation/condensation protein A [Candidatus Parcubacteria bacterium]